MSLLLRIMLKMLKLDSSLWELEGIIKIAKKPRPNKGYRLCKSCPKGNLLINMSANRSLNGNNPLKELIFLVISCLNSNRIYIFQLRKPFICPNSTFKVQLSRIYCSYI